jgi:primosomal protein N' (replication factor Y)
MRVIVPLGTRTVTGCVMELAAEAPRSATSGPLKDIARALDPEPFLPDDILRLTRWMADYYLCGPGDAIGAALPPMARSRDEAFKRQRVVRITDAGRHLTDSDAISEKQRLTLDTLQEAIDGVSVADLTTRGVSAAVVSRLAGRGLVSITEETVERDPFMDGETAVAPGETAGLDTQPTEEQQQVLSELERLAERRVFGVSLLHGVTGSGKTLLYLRLAETIRRGGRGVIVLVPEIALTPAMAALFRRAFGTRVAIQHSGLSDGARHDQWHRIRRGDVDVVVGTRSAVFAPLANLGLIVVDEEHDTSYKQDESPRYHGRDVAVMRASHAGAHAVLGSATPSLESFHRALAGRYHLVSLTRRVLDRPLADVRIVDMRPEYAAEGPDIVLSAQLRSALADRLERGEQSLLLLNRRGYATAVFCRQCAATLECPNCSVTLTLHRASGRARCHYCDHSRRVPEACPACGGEFLESRGIGTERIEAEVRKQFPDARVARVDRDTIRRRGAIARVLRDVGAGTIDILIGTQMIAKGHDFPAVTLVGVISADVGLGLADFRAAERTFQLLTQVVGRAGRGERPGEAIVQTLYPRHYSIVHASRQDYRAFVEAELVYRRAMRYPPAVSLVNVIVKAPSGAQALRDAGVLARALRGYGGSLETLGPAGAPLRRLRGDHRAQLLLKSVRRPAMREAVLDALARHPELARRTIIDVDPVSML